MQRLRTTFKRSRTPTGAEMKAQSSLEVPKQVRSASFDEIQLEAKRQISGENVVRSCDFLHVPATYPGQRSRSVDSSSNATESSYLEVPRRFQRRRSSGSSRNVACVHCSCMEEFTRLNQSASRSDGGSSPSLSSYTDDDDDDDNEELEYDDDDAGGGVGDDDDGRNDSSLSESDFGAIPRFEVMVTLPPPVEPIEGGGTPGRRRSISRQEAFVVEPGSLENVSDGTLSDSFTTAAVAPIPGLVVKDIYLQVPDLKRDRAASVDSCFSKVSQGKTEELQHSGVSLEVPVSPNVALRSRSVDIVLPTNEQARYKALALAAPPGESEKNTSTGQARKTPAIDVAERILRNTPDWSENAINGDHVWSPTSVSGDFCYISDADCTKHGNRMKCSACNVVVHQNCIPVLIDKMHFSCKSTFRDVGLRQYREQTSIQHHWVHRRSEKGKCRQCGKSFQSKLSFSCKEIVAISCSWCKAAYHNKETCFNMQRIDEQCKLGVHSNIIVPPSWIIKLPRKGSFKSSLRKSPKKKSASSKRRNKDKDKEPRTFIIKPIPSASVTPVIVFINPKSGGNQGTKLLQKFQWLLNPRQVFDLTQGGPRMGLELFKKVPNLRILACGGDGTVGWILSVIDQIGIVPPPSVGVLPLGTGNDLARALGWGGGYTDEPISKILSNVSDSQSVLLDRWSLEVQRNPNGVDNKGGAKDSLPLNVVNNYYSLGVDAQIALEFHEAREAHPEKFNSRLRNKMFYGQMGGKDLLRRKWKGLADFVTLECDGKDLTPKLKELKVHAVVFLNISSYGGGTKPWNRSLGAVEPSTEDGLIEVVGLTTYQLPLLQAGGHGACITQCRSAKIVTSKTIPMQVDGEACKLSPSIITLSLLNKAPMLAKRKPHHSPSPPQTTLDNIKISVYTITMADYEQHHYDKELLAQTGVDIGSIEVNPIVDLEQIRNQINELLEKSSPYDIQRTTDWCFLDACTAERFFRIDRAQENLHYVCDIATDHLFILLCYVHSAPQTPDEDSTSNIVRQVAVPVISAMRVSDEGSLDSPSDQPPPSPKKDAAVSCDEELVAASRAENPLEPASAHVKIRRYISFLFAVIYLYTKPLVDVL